MHGIIVVCHNLLSSGMYRSTTLVFDCHSYILHYFNEIFFTFAFFTASQSVILKLMQWATAPLSFR